MAFRSKPKPRRLSYRMWLSLIGIPLAIIGVLTPLLTSIFIPQPTGASHTFRELPAILLSLPQIFLTIPSPTVNAVDARYQTNSYVMTQYQGRPIASLAIAKYRGNKKAAVTFTFDDGLQGQIKYAVPLLNKYHYHGTFFVIAGLTRQKITDHQIRMPSWECWDSASWEEWRTVAAQGHEIGNHSMTHPHNLTSFLSSMDLYEEVNYSANIITEEIGKRPLTYAYPYNDWDTRLNHYVLQTNVMAREWQDLYAFGKTTAFLHAKNASIDNAIRNGYWFVPMLHGLAAGEWGQVDPKIFDQHLRYIKSHSHALWVDTYANVARYSVERYCALIKVQSAGKRSVRFSLSCSPLDSTIYNVPLTLVITTASGNVILKNVIPDGEPVTVTW